MSESAAVSIGGVQDGVVQITIRRSGKRNVLREVEHDRMMSIWTEFDSRSDVRAIVITGEGGHFSAGGDLSFVNDICTMDEVRANAWWSARGIVRGMLDCRKPIVSALEGVSAGAGNAIALMSDICIAAEDAKIIDGHIAYGASPGDHAAFLWPLAIGINRAKGKLLLGEPISGAEAAAIGLVFEAVPHGQALPRAMEIATKLATYDPFVVGATKVSLNGLLRQHWQVFEASLALEFMCFTNTSTQTIIAAAASQKSGRPDTAEESQRS